MRLRVTSVDEFQLLKTIEHSIWGSKSARFAEWEQGDYLLFLVDKSLAALAKVSGDPYRSDDVVWDNGIFPHRIPLDFIHFVDKDKRQNVLGDVRDIFTSVWGTFYGWGILNQSLLEGENVSKILAAIKSKPNMLNNVKSNLQQLLQEANQMRNVKTKRKKSSLKKLEKTTAPPDDEDISETKKEATLHTRAQHALIKIGNAAGCSVWVASNDRKRTYRGKNLAETCLDSLPNMGLNEHATKIISLIDILWIQKNAPICAFEVETTTSIYSGLLRMSDLLAEVPLLKLNLYIIAPKSRKIQVLRQLSRPTFRRIGLSDFCHFISIEDLEKLIEKVSGLEGSVNPNIIDKIAIELK